jgi:hypothetical protein
MAEEEQQVGDDVQQEYEEDGMEHEDGLQEVDVSCLCVGGAASARGAAAAVFEGWRQHAAAPHPCTSINTPQHHYCPPPQQELEAMKQKLKELEDEANKLRAQQVRARVGAVAVAAVH